MIESLPRQTLHKSKAMYEILQWIHLPKYQMSVRVAMRIIAMFQKMGTPPMVRVLFVVMYG